MLQLIIGIIIGGLIGVALMCILAVARDENEDGNLYKK